MTPVPQVPSQDGPKFPWVVALVAGILVPAFTMVMQANASAAGFLADLIAPIMAVALMGAGMITAAAAGRMGVGVAIAITTGAGLVLLALMLGLPPLRHGLFVAFAIGIASISFAARGTLFARSAGARGWWIAVAIVAGEGAILFTAIASPDAMPRWLLALLPAQWASTAMQTAMRGTGSGVAIWELLALAGTAAATLIVATLWPRRWPYLIMFGTWIILSVMVWQQPAFF